MVPLSDVEQDVLEVAVMYYGDADYAKANAQPLTQLNAPYNHSENVHCSFTVYDSFVESWAKVNAFTNGVANALVFNDLVPTDNLTQELAQTMVGFFNSSSVLRDGLIRCMTSVLMGGAVSERGDDFTAVHPGFRNSWMELGLSLYWSGDAATQHAEAYSNEWEAKLRPFGFGIYSNEENYACDGCDWTDSFWGDHYDKLLQVKQAWDPESVFWCYHCVGDQD